MSSGVHVFRFSLTALFGAVLFAAFGTAAIRFASPLWAGITMAVTVPILFAAILGALFRLGQARAFWTGMAICGWGYLLLVLVPVFESGIGQHLPTSYLLNFVHDQLQKQVTITVIAGGGMPMAGGPSLGMPGPGAGGPMMPGMGSTSSGGMGGSVTTMTTGGPDHSLVLRTGHALFALLFGFVGGVTAKWFYLTRSPREDEAGKG